MFFLLSDFFCQGCIEVTDAGSFYDILISEGMEIIYVGY